MSKTKKLTLWILLVMLLSGFSYLYVSQSSIEGLESKATSNSSRCQKARERRDSAESGWVRSDEYPDKTGPRYQKYLNYRADAKRACN